jgi:hypothetical protein
MAISLGTVTSCARATKASGPRPTHTIAAHEYELESWLVSVNHNDQSNAYAQADGCTFNPTAALAACARDGHARTALQACCVEAGEDNSTLTLGGTGANAVSVAAGVVHSHMYVEDGTTEKGNGAWAAASTWTKDVVYDVLVAKYIV